jgi:hypothetical protein
LLSELPFAAFLSYDPHRSDELSRRSRSITYALKQDAAYGATGRTYSEEVARRMTEEVPGSALDGFLDSEAVLVPMPRSGLMRSGDLWPAFRIAEALVAHGFAASVSPVISRSGAVRRSSTAAGADRLWPDQHYDSMEVARTLGAIPGLIVLVDDVITRGATLLGAASRLAEAFPDTELRGFAAVRTIGPGEVLERIANPVVGEITWKPGWISRDP